MNCNVGGELTGTRGDGRWCRHCRVSNGPAWRFGFGTVDPPWRFYKGLVRAVGIEQLDHKINIAYRPHTIPHHFPTSTSTSLLLLSPHHQPALKYPWPYKNIHIHISPPSWTRYGIHTSGHRPSVAGGDRVHHRDFCYAKACSLGSLEHLLHPRILAFQPHANHILRPLLAAIESRTRTNEGQQQDRPHRTILQRLQQRERHSCQ